MVIVPDISLINSAPDTTCPKWRLPGASPQASARPPNLWFSGRSDTCLTYQLRWHV